MIKRCQIIPELIFNNLEGIEEQIKPHIKGFDIDNMKEVLTILSSHIRKENKLNPSKKNNSAQLRLDYINELVPQGGKYLKHLVLLGYIKIVDGYIPGEKSYSYKYTEKWESKYVFRNLNNPKLARRIDKVYEKYSKLRLKTLRTYADQVKYLKLLTIVDGWQEFIDLNCTDSVHQRNCVIASAMRIINKDFYYSIDKTAGRFHSNLTSMKRGLKQFLRVKGEKLVNIDVKNCQPYLALLLLTNPQKAAFLAKDDSELKYILENLEISECEDIELFKKLVLEGTFYEYLMEEFKNEGFELSRDDTKIQVLKIFFASNDLPSDKIDPTNLQCRLIFMSLFPNVHNIFSQIRGDSFFTYNRFAILLQSIEAYVMLDFIMKRVYKVIPKIIAMTVHDSIMVGEGIKCNELVKKIMIEEFKEFIGFEPKVKIESYEE